jgi:hypothetical protein
LSQQRWWSKAACKDNEQFFDFPSDSKELNKSRQICNSCEVKPECFAYRFKRQTKGEDGVYAGTNSLESCNLIASISGVSSSMSFDEISDKMRQIYSQNSSEHNHNENNTKSA